MRRVLVATGLAALLAGCGETAVGPADTELRTTLAELASLGYSVAHVAEGPPPGPDGLIQRLGRLPPELALTEQQAAQIRALVQAFVAATAADREALAAALKAAAEARQAGRPAEEVRAILQRAREARVRLYQAELALRRAVLAVLTPAQRAWLAANGSGQPGPCALTDAQRTEISALRAAFEEANAADLALVRATYERARAARAAGASRDQIVAILAEAKPALERLRAARKELREKILAVLTPEQRAAGCGR